MNQIQKWKYYVAYCSFKETKKPRAFGQREGYWILQLDKEFSLTDGLNYMGELGYELVGIQATTMLYGGDTVNQYDPSYFYIFKAPMKSQSENTQS